MPYPDDSPLVPFTLDPQLAADTHPVGDLPLCAVRLLRDSRFPWLILVPRQAGATELFDLSAPDRAVLIEEVTHAAQALQAMTGALKINVAALGNQVRQLHVHVIARFPTDAAWPRPVWGVGTSSPYAAPDAEAMVAKLAHALELR